MERHKSSHATFIFSHVPVNKHINASQLSYICLTHSPLPLSLQLSLSRSREESQSIADVILSKKADFFVFTTFIGHYDRSVSLLEDSCRSSPAFAAVVSQFEVGTNSSSP